MALFLTSVLIFSSIAMATLLCVKHWELSTGRVVFQTIRPKVSVLSHRLLALFEQHLPLLVRQWAQSTSALVWTSLHKGTAQGLLSAERGLEHALETVRRATTEPKKSQGQVSAFLCEVAEYKKKLVRRTRAQHPKKLVP